MATKAPRRYELDWLRVGAILAVFVFHSSRFFDLDGWHVKNPTTYLGVQLWVSFVAAWLMPLIFVISGASLFYSVRSRGAGKFIIDKVLRLLVPLVVGSLTHVMLQVYLERLTHYEFRGSFWAFIPHYFDGLYGFGGNFAWMGLHLWYLLVLFLFSLLLYPVFRWLSVGRIGARVLSAVGTFLALPGTIYLLALPVAGLFVTLDPRDVLGARDFGGWPLPCYLLTFFYGFLVMSHEGLQSRIRRLRWVSLGLGVASTVPLFFVLASQRPVIFGTARYTQVFGLFSLTSWTWVLTILGFGFRYLRRTSPLLAPANEAVLPFYILHQTVLLVVGYFVTRWAIPDLAKFLIISAGSFVLIISIYALVIRRSNVFRVLFGMKPQPANAAAKAHLLRRAALQPAPRKASR